MLKFHTNDTTVLTTYSFVKRNYRHLFPNLCSRSCFNRTRRALLQTTELLRQKLPSAFMMPYSRFFIVDSFPLAVCKFGRARYCRAFRGIGADYGMCPSKKETCFGYKVHAMVTLEGYVTTFEVTPASTDDREGLRDLIDGQHGLVVPGGQGLCRRGPGGGHVRTGDMPHGAQALQQQDGLAQACTAADIQAAQTRGDCILSAD